MKCGRFPLSEVHNRITEYETVLLGKYENIGIQGVLESFKID